ncbi:MAG: acyl-CoA thioesterase [Acidimicrobiia bacterium]
MASESAELDRLRRAVGVQAIDGGTARAVTRANVDGKRLFGGQMIAQSLAACEHTVPAGMVPDSMHANLLGQGEPYDTIDYTIERVRDGGSLQHRDVRGVQRGRPIVHTAVVTAKPRDGLTWQRPAMPEVGPPDVGGSQPPPWATELGDDGSEIVNPVGGDGGQVPSHPLWFRTSVDVPANDIWLNAVVLAYWSDFGLNGAAIQAIWAAGARPPARASPIRCGSTTRCTPTTGTCS